MFILNTLLLFYGFGFDHYSARSIELVVNQPFATNFLEGLENIRLPSTSLLYDARITIDMCSMIFARRNMYLQVQSQKMEYSPTCRLESTIWTRLFCPCCRHYLLRYERSRHKDWKKTLTNTVNWIKGRLCTSENGKINLFTDFGVRTCFLYWSDIMKAVFFWISAFIVPHCQTNC